MRTALNAFSPSHCFLTANYKYVASFEKKLCVLLKTGGQNFRWLNALSFAFMLCDDEILFPWLRISILLLFYYTGSCQFFYHVIDIYCLQYDFSFHSSIYKVYGTIRSSTKASREINLRYVFHAL